MADAEKCVCCGKPLSAEGKQCCTECLREYVGTCKECSHFIGLGDWGLCCDLKYDLCYEDTPGCDRFEREDN